MIEFGGFALLPAGESVEGWRTRLAIVRYGVVVDSRDRALTCVDAEDLESEPSWEAPLPPALLIDEVGDPVREALHRMEGNDWLRWIAGAVVVDSKGHPVGVVSRAALLCARFPAGLDYRAAPEVPQEGAARHGQLDFPRYTVPGARYPLIVTVRERAAPGSAELRLPPGSWPLRLTVTLVGLDPDDFEVVGPRAGVLEVPERGDSAELVFTLIPRSLGRKVVRVRFEHGREWLGVARVSCVVAERAPVSEPAPVESAPAITHASLPPDVTIHLTATGPGRYDLEVQTKDDGPARPARLIDRIELREDPRSFMDRLFADLEDSSGTADLDDLAQRLGTALYERLFQSRPADSELEGFNSFYWSRMRPRSEHPDPALRWSTVQIVGDDPFPPWEIMRPTRRLPDGRWQSDVPLCQRFELARWLSSAEAAGRIALRRRAIVAPRSDLPWAAAEVGLLRRGGGWSSVLSDKRSLGRLLRGSPEVDVLHFVCHGRFAADAPERSVIWIGDARFSPIEVSGEQKTFGRSRPLVFVNACDTGRSGFGISGLEGWVQAFLGAGAAVFVSSLWSVDDQAAFLFASKFYEMLRAGRTVGAAARAGRSAAAITSGNVAHLGFVVFANPCVKLSESG